MKEGKKYYCHCCGKYVEVMILVERGDELIHCSACGQSLHEADGEPPESPTKLRRVIIAEDSRMLRDMMGDILKDRGLTDSCISCENGEDFVTMVTRGFVSNVAFDLAILDINMPIMSGLNAAIALRGVEKGFGLTKKMPILFFSIKQADDAMRKALEYLKPCSYVNKGTSSDPAELAERIYRVLTKLLKD